MLVLAMGIYHSLGYHRISTNNKKLQKAFTSLTEEKISLNTVIPFAWDVIYTIPPYMSKEDISSMIGFDSRHIKENQINEGMVHLIFVHENKIVASILDYPENLGYQLICKNKITYDQDNTFQVQKQNTITIIYKTKQDT